MDFISYVNLFPILTGYPEKVYNGIVNLSWKNVETGLDKLKKMCKIYVQLHISLIKSGGGNGPMKHGNLAKAKVPNPAANER